MMNSIQNTAKYLRLINIKTALNTLKECKPNYVKNVPREKFDFVSRAKTITFSPRNFGLEITEKPSEGKVKQDPISYIPIINPRSILPLVDTNWRNDEVGLPAIRQEEIQAARLIVIRRKKMKKHQRRKLWKRMRHRWARVKQRRRQIKEKIFQNELLAMIKEANEFSAEAYVADKLRRANHTPQTGRHRRTSELILKEN